MTQHLIPFRFAAFCALAAAWLAPISAQAQSACAVDADCGDGLVCEVVGGSTCASPACPPGETCPEPDPCVSEVFYGCVPGPCASDADCGEDLVCKTFESGACTSVDVACAPGETCDVPQPVCEIEQTSLCVPVYLGACTADADCGSGFTCIEGEICECSGGMAAPLPPEVDGGAAGAPASDPLPVPEDCSCAPSGEKYCDLIEVPCAAAGDCPADWSCEEVSDAPDCAVSSDGSAPDCAPAVVQSLCMPPNWEVFGTTGGSDTSALGTPVRAEVDPASPAAPGAGSADSASQNEGGCQLAPVGSSPAPWLLLLGLVGVATRRRRSL